MRHIIRSFITLSILSSALPLWGQEQGDKKKETSSQEQYERLVELQEVPVTARRPLSNVGTTMTTLDTLTLRETVVNSIADVLAQNTPIFIKSYGRGSLATASFRGTAPSHTQVLWNGMKLNSPTLGMVDFSMIPSFFIDKGSLYHGASSVGVVGGGLGGAVALDTKYTPGLDGVKLNFLGPEFHGEALFVFGYRQLYGMGQGGGSHRAAVMVAQAGFVSGGGDNGGTGVGAERVQILAQRGSPLMAALAGSQADAADDGEGVPARQGIKIGNSHHDIVFLVGGGALWDQVKVPQILLRGL